MAPDSPPSGARLARAAAPIALLAMVAGCHRDAPPGETDDTPDDAAGAPAPTRVDGTGRGGKPGAATGAEVPTKPQTLVGALYQQTPVYAQADRETRIGYIRRGAKVAVDATPIRAPNCDAGWFRLTSGGYVCGKFVTLDLNRPEVRLGAIPPSTDDPLPYQYASNIAMGTPLYKSVPSREAMLDYEPYLKGRADDNSPPPLGYASPGTAAPSSDPSAGREPRSPIAELDPHKDVPPLSDPIDPDPAASADKTPWWQKTYDSKHKPDIRLSDLTEDADKVVARRLVRGFYIAIDKEFTWHGRKWYRTTGGLVTPADRFAPIKPSTFQGLDLTGSDPKQTAGFVLSTKALKYVVADAGGGHKTVAVKEPVDRFTAVRLTGNVAKVANGEFRETADGWWLKSSQGTFTEPGPPPEGLAPGEKWIDVNLTRQTLVAFEGDNPVFATLVSSGRKPPTPDDKAHDHRTVQGSFRIREKHISTTMDGDGPAPGDMPYSIEDVPYVMYFKDSYALHAAFWHGDFGHEHSHGCVNLAPLDAKRLFAWTDPAVPSGWHAGLSPKESAGGTRVVVHE